MMKLTPIALAVLLTGCGTIGNAVRTFDEPTVTRPQLKVEENLKEPAAGAIAVAVYNFRDMTGQRKASQNIASLSSAVTQGADAYLVKSLQEVGSGRWFKVLERGGLDNLVKERQLIRQMRELYQGKDAQPLPPMMFAGIILEGGIIGYDSNTMSGGSGARILGIGASTEYRQDEVTISLRAVSVATGEVLVAVNTNKTVYSFQDKLGVLRFYDAGTQALELETGSATNESMNKAVQLAIHAAVIELINSGARKGHWAFKTDVVAVPQTRSEPVVVKEEVKKDELVQPETSPKEEKPAAPAAIQSDDRKDSPKEQSTSDSKNTDTNTKLTVQPKVTLGNVTDWSNLRKERDFNSEKLANLRPGTQVEVLDTKGDHYVVKVDGKEGYLARKFVKVQQ
jgi:curli production assembly/transport component CsgG